MCRVAVCLYVTATDDVTALRSHADGGRDPTRTAEAEENTVQIDVEMDLLCLPARAYDCAGHLGRTRARSLYMDKKYSLTDLLSCLSGAII